MQLHSTSRYTCNLLGITIGLLATSITSAAISEIYLFDPNHRIEDRFGTSVAIDGNTAIVGEPRHETANPGEAFVFDATTGNSQRIIESSPTVAHAEFGTAVAIQNNIIVSGAPKEFSGGFSSGGSAYIHNATTGAQIHKLNPNGVAGGANFGTSVDIFDRTVIVGAPLNTDSPPNNPHGAAYLFDAVSGGQIAKLTASDGDGFDHFGNAVSISGNTALVGAVRDENETGAAYLYNFSDLNNIGETKLLSDDIAANDKFGRSVAVSGSLAVIGANGDNSNTGAAYIFDIHTGNQLVKLTADDGTAGDNFGWSVAIDGRSVIVGAPNNDDDGDSSGSAYFFDISNPLDITQSKITSSNARAGDRFGVSVDIDGTNAIVGAFRKNLVVYPEAGAAYIYDLTTIPEPTTAILFTLATFPLLSRKRTQTPSI
ncbi:hypothetical protein [Poriferisphaera sp. WC338]|uniref:FG-GAP repeat protein n=1 Tax=Poriferisphaera sp. WC338 TaxID=3425129 RepID=UPI003D81B94A